MCLLLREMLSGVGGVGVSGSDAFLRVTEGNLRLSLFALCLRHCATCLLRRSSISQPPFSLRVVLGSLRVVAHPLTNAVSQ